MKQWQITNYLVNTGDSVFKKSYKNLIKKFTLFFIKARALHKRPSAPEHWFCKYHSIHFIILIHFDYPVHANRRALLIRTSSWLERHFLLKTQWLQGKNEQNLNITAVWSPKNLIERHPSLCADVVALTMVLWYLIKIFQIFTKMWFRQKKFYLHRPMTEKCLKLGVWEGHFSLLLD